jgi:hypothetical protein
MAFSSPQVTVRSALSPFTPYALPDLLPSVMLGND